MLPSGLVPVAKHFPGLRRKYFREIQQREEHPLPHPAAAPGRIHGERRHVGLVDHDPEPGEGHDLAVRAGHDVAREAVPEELVAIGLVRPRHGEAPALDGVDGVDVVERHRLDPEGYRGSRDHATPPSPGSSGTPRGGLA